MVRNNTKDEWQFLKNVGSNYELEMITSILAQERILVMKKSKGSGAYTDVIMGASLTGYDIYVPSQSLVQAKEIIDNLPVFEAEEIDYNELPADQDVVPSASQAESEEGFILRNRHILKILFFIFIIIPLLFGLVVALFLNYRS
jgi:hypothetical protein